MRRLLAVRLGLALAVALAFAPRCGRAEVQQLSVDPLVPLGRAPLTFTVAGVQPSLCYKRVILEEMTGVEDQVITLWFALELTTAGTCPLVPTAFTLDFDFDQGLPAGEYTVRVGERTFVRGGSFTDRVLQFAVVIDPNPTGIAREMLGWGAVKALFGEDRPRN